MIDIRKNSARLAVAAVLGISVMGAATSVAWSAPAPQNEATHDWAKERQDRIKHFTDRLANRLEIKASQQNAWQAFVKTLEPATERPAKNAEIKTDAASIARLHADMAAARAQKLSRIADATAKLQAVLDPDQRQTLDQVAMHMGSRYGHRFHGGWSGERRDHERGDREHRE